MRERLIQLFDGIANEDQLQLILEACDVLTGMNYIDYEDAIEQFFGLPDSQSGEAVFVVTQKILVPIFQHAILAMGVTPSTEITLGQLKDLLFWLQFIPNFEDRDILHQLATTDEPSEDTLVDILSVVSALPEEYFTPMISGVASSLIERIHEITAGYESSDVPDPADFDRAKQRLLLYLEWLKKDNPELASAIDLSDLRLGLSGEIILAKYRVSLEHLENKTCARMLLFYLLSSDLPTEQILTAAGKEVEILFEDFLRGVEVMRHCETIMGQLRYA